MTSYVETIDNMVDKILEDYFIDIIEKNKEFLMIVEDPNFVKYQKEINGYFVEYSKKLENTELNNIIKNEYDIHYVKNTLAKYFVLYTFIAIGYLFPHSEKRFSNNIMEFNKNQTSYPFRIDDFFNSESNSVIIQLKKICLQIRDLVGLMTQDKEKLKQYSKRPEYAETFRLLKTISPQVIDSALSLDGQYNKGNKLNQMHNIIKIVLTKKLYFEQDRKVIFDVLEQTASTNTEFRYIEIVLPKTTHIEQNIIENSLPTYLRGKGYDDIIYSMINIDPEAYGLTEHDKIHELLKNRLLIPVTEDFLLFHKDSEKYDIDTKQQSIKKGETKIKYIVTKIELASDRYSVNTKTNPKLQEQSSEVFNKNMANLDAVLINDFEDQRIIIKLINSGIKALEENIYINDLLFYIEYPYINYKNMGHNGFSYTAPDTINAVRLNTFDPDNKLNYTLTRVLRPNRAANIVGFVIPGKVTHFCLNCDEYTNIEDLGKDVSNKAKVIGLLKYIINKNKNPSKDHVWLFGENDTQSTEAEVYDKSAEYVKMLVNIFDHTAKNVNSKIQLVLAQMKTNKMLSQELAKKLIDLYCKNFIDIRKITELSDDLQKQLYYSLLHNSAYDIDENGYYKIDQRSNIFYGSNENAIELPEVEIQEKSTEVIIKLTNKIEYERFERSTSLVGENLIYMCQHEIDLDELKTTRNTNLAFYEKLHKRFYDKYIIHKVGVGDMCKSCGIKFYTDDLTSGGTYSKEGYLSALTTEYNVELEESREYEKYIPLISYMYKALRERYSIIYNVQQFQDTSSSSKFANKVLVKSLIDLSNTHHRLFAKNYQEYVKSYPKFNIDSNYSFFSVFELDPHVFTKDPNANPQLKAVKQLNVSLTLLLLIILDMNPQQIALIPTDKICNTTYASKLLNRELMNIRIYKNNQLTTASLNDYPNFISLVFMMTCLFVKNKLWPAALVSEDSKTFFSPLIHKQAIYSVIAILNSIVEAGIKNKDNTVYSNFLSKYFRKLSTIYSKQNATIQKKILDTTSIKSTIIKLVPDTINHWGVNLFNSCNAYKYYVGPIDTVLHYFTFISRATNCPRGSFHHWKFDPKNKSFSCTICLEAMDPNKEDLVIEREHAYSNLNISRLSLKFCQKGGNHNFERSSKDSGKTVCTKCGLVQGSVLTDDKDLAELNQTLAQNYNQKETVEVTSIIEYQVSESNRRVGSFKAVEEFMQTFLKYRPTNYIQQLIKQLQDNVGLGKYFDKADTYLQQRIYYINHDHIGNKLPSPIKITPSEERVTVKDYHQFFKVPVIAILNAYANKYTFYYHSKSYKYLGFQEKQNYTTVTVPNYLIVRYSTEEQIKLLGYEDESYFFDTETQGWVDLVKVIRKRISALKQIINDIMTCIYKMHNKTDRTDQLINDKLKNIIISYTPLFSSIPSDKLTVFENWSVLNYNVNINVDDLKKIIFPEKSGYIDSKDLSAMNMAGDALIYYLVGEFAELLTTVTNSTDKVAMSSFIVDIIEYYFSYYSNYYIKISYELVKFSVLVNTRFGLLTEKLSDIQLTDEINEEAVYDANEEYDALDVEDGKIDYEAEVSIE